MDNNLHTIINGINERNNQKMFDIAKIRGIEHFLAKIPKLDYIGHGVQSICFKTGDDYVVKCCMKRKNSIIFSKELFTSVTQDLLKRNFPILPMKEVLYEDETWIVYTQPLCLVVDLVTFKFCYQVVEFIQQMVENNIRFSDIYFRNFGIYQNKILLFDYHEMETFNSSSNFLITNLYSLFTLLGQQLNWNVRQTKICHWDDIIKDNFGRSMFPVPISGLIESLHQRDREQTINSLETALIYLKGQFQMNFNTYRSLCIDDDGIIKVHYPSKSYELIFNLIKNEHLCTILDIHSNELGIGLKLAQDFPNISLTVGCRTDEEVIDTKTIIQQCVIYNASTIKGPIVDIKSLTGERFDLVLYHSTVYNLLQTNRMMDLPRVLRTQVGRYCLIEVPIKGDHDLMKLMEQQKVSYDFLLNPYTFRTYLNLQKIRAIRCLHVDYGNKYMKKYLFICKIG